MKMVVGTLGAFLLAGVLFSQQAEARCWWNGYNHCRSTIMGGGTTAGIIRAIGIVKQVAAQ
jgi:hypothetical protein